MPAASAPTTSRPTALASTMTRPKPSLSEGTTSTSIEAMRSAMSVRVPVKCTTVGQAQRRGVRAHAIEPADVLDRRLAADGEEPDVRTTLVHLPGHVQEVLDAFLGAEHADEADDGRTRREERLTDVAWRVRTASKSMKLCTTRSRSGGRCARRARAVASELATTMVAASSSGSIARRPHAVSGRERRSARPASRAASRPLDRHVT